jgi:hypothetical protein
MREHPQFAILVLSTVDKNYQRFVEGVRKTWMACAQKRGIPTYFYYGNQSENRVMGECIGLNVGDQLTQCSRKLCSALEQILGMYPNLDFVYRTNLSSYLDIDTMLAYIEQYRVGRDTYSGRLGTCHMLNEFFFPANTLYWWLSSYDLGRARRFASGSGFFLGRNNIEKVLERRRRLFCVDDVMVACNLDKEPDRDAEPLRLDFEQEEGSLGLERDQYEAMVRDRKLFHYRFKTRNRDLDAERLHNFDDQKFRERLILRG